MSASYNQPLGGTLSGTGKDAIEDDVRTLADHARNDLADLGKEVKEQVGSLKEEASTQLEHVATKAKSLAAEQKDLLTEQIGGVVDAIDKVASELEGNNTASAGYVRVVADGAKKLSSTLKDNDVDAILNKAQDFARQQPVAFMGAAALLGFAASRFVLASATRTTSPSNNSSGAFDGGVNG
jgi:hypothetical protein